MSGFGIRFNPRALRPAMRVDRPKGARVTAGNQASPGPAGTKETAHEAYWRGFADGAREIQAWSEEEIQAYYMRTRGF